MSVEIHGVAELVERLGMATAIETLEPPMQRAVLGLQAGMAKYPPAIPGSKYIRGHGYEGGPATSEKLGQSWTTLVEPTGNGLTGKVGNVASYAPQVQGAATQAVVHQGRWQTDESELDRQAPIIVADFEDAISRALEGK